jgi:dihydrofolate reductase
VSRIILSLSVSIDGMFEDADGTLEWQTIDEELHQYFNDELRSAGAFVSGRVTYEMMEGYWPTAHTEPDAPAPILDFAEIWQRVPKVVYSRTLDVVGPNATLVRSVEPSEVLELRERSDGDLYVGGPVLAESFLRHGLVDAVVLYVHPVVLGSGRRMFNGDLETLPLALEDTKVFSSGVVMLRYGRR